MASGVFKNHLSFRTSRPHQKTSSSDQYNAYCCLMSANESCSCVARTLVKEHNMKLNSLAFLDRGGAHCSVTDDMLVRNHAHWMVNRHLPALVGFQIVSLL